MPAGLIRVRVNVESGKARSATLQNVPSFLYKSQIIKVPRVGGIKAIIPEVTGRAFVTGMHTFVIDEDDPFKYGFRL